MFKKKKRKKCNKMCLNDYPCDVYLHNALRFIVQDKSGVAYDEICNAILSSGGELSNEENRYRLQLKGE